jgi:hypothetical protein
MEMATQQLKIDVATARHSYQKEPEAEAKASDIVAFDRAVTLEDKAVLEATDYDAPLDLSKEQHMASDKPGILMRHKLAALLKAHGEVEQSRVCN